MKHPKTAFTLVLIGLGYLGAAMFYWRWWPRWYATEVYYQLASAACPVCPNIDSMGTDVQKFLGRTAFLGAINAMLFVAGGWLLLGVVRLIRRIT